MVPQSGTRKFHSVGFYYILIIFIINVLPVLSRAVSQCAGQNIYLDCGTDEWLIHVQYEVYGYNQSEGCKMSGSGGCTGAEFLDPPSIRHCNGRPSCNFTVPTDKYLTVCKENATTLEVVYNCVPKFYNYDMCSDFLKQHTSMIFLMSHNYPATKMAAMSCSCEMTGQNVSVLTIEHYKAFLSPVVLILSTNDSTKHITKTSVINRLEFSSVSYMKIILDNRYPDQDCKLWLKLTGLGMKVKCGSPVIVPVKSQITSSYMYSSYLPSTTNSPLSSLNRTEVEPSSTSSITLTSAQINSFSANYTEITAPLSTDRTSAAANNTKITPPLSTVRTSVAANKTDIIPPSSLDQSKVTTSSDKSVALSSSSIHLSSAELDRSTQRVTQSEETILLAVAISVCCLFVIIFIVATILLCSKKMDRELSDSMEDIHQPEHGIINAYDQDIEEDFNIIL